MLKDRSKLLLLGIIMNSIAALIGIISMFFVFLQLVDIVPFEATEIITADMIQMGFVSMLIQVGYLILSLFAILSGIFSLVDFIKKNDDFVLTSIILTVICIILYIIVGPSFGNIGFIGLIVAFVLMTIGYIKEHKKKF